MGSLFRPFLVLFTCCALHANTEDQSKPNVLFILTDDLGVMDTSLRDQHFYETPNLERLAARGMRFTNGYCAHPRCVPSRYAIQTGRFPCRDTMNAGPPETKMRKLKLIGEAFQEQGYATFFTGKWHLGKEEKDWPHHCGFDINIGGCHAGAPGSYFFPFHVARKTGKEDKYGPLHQLTEGVKDEHLTERTTRETEQFIRRQLEAGDGKPFFAIVSHYAVHTPIEGKPDEVAVYEAKAASLPGADLPAYLKKDGQTKRRRDNPHYASMVKTMDESVGGLLDLLDELEIADNTIIAFTSDHGGLSNRGLDSKRDTATSNLPFRAGKGHLYEGGLRVPFLIAYPGIVEAGSTSDEIAVGTDLYPTLLDLAGLETFPKSHADGVSLVPALKGEKMQRKRPVIWHGPLPRPTQTGDQAASAIRIGDLKLMKHYFPESIELYNLKEDPYEANDLSGSDPETAQKLKDRLERILTRFEAMEPRKDWKDKTVTAPLSSSKED